MDPIFGIYTQEKILKIVALKHLNLIILIGNDDVMTSSECNKMGLLLKYQKNRWFPTKFLFCHTWFMWRGVLYSYNISLLILFFIFYFCSKEALLEDAANDNNMLSIVPSPPKFPINLAYIFKFLSFFQYVCELDYDGKGCKIYKIWTAWYIIFLMSGIIWLFLIIWCCRESLSQHSEIVGLWDTGNWIL